jgi:beta-glucanase (GH16 family)
MRLFPLLLLPALPYLSFAQSHHHRHHQQQPPSVATPAPTPTPTPTPAADPTPAPSATPIPVSGYHLSFADEFDALNLSPTGFGAYTWYPGIWWDSRLPLPSLETVSNSVLDLAWSRNGGGLSNTSISTIAKDGSQGRTFRYGYFEARMKWDVVNGSWPAFWLIPKQAINGEQHTGEIDIFEGQGAEPRTFNGTIHEWQGGSNVWSNNPNWYTLPAGNDFSQWHTYGLLWEPGTVTWYYDNQKLFSSPTRPIFDQQDFFIVIGSGVGANWSEGNLQGVAANTINLNVDWVHVWQK